MKRDTQAWSRIRGGWNGIYRRDTGYRSMKRDKPVWNGIRGRGAGYTGVECDTQASDHFLSSKWRNDCLRTNTSISFFKWLYSLLPIKYIKVDGLKMSTESLMKGNQQTVKGVEVSVTGAKRVWSFVQFRCR